MAAEDVDAYLAQVEEPKRSTLEQLRRDILAVVPDAEQVISYSCPAFRRDGRVFAGFAAFKDHLSYLPHSGSVIGRLPEEFAGYKGTPGSLHFPIDQPLPKALVEKLVGLKLEENTARRR